MSRVAWYQIGDYRYSPQTGLFRGTEEVRLIGIPRRILDLLLRQPGQPVTEAELWQTFWGSKTHVNPNSLNAHINRLRSALGDTNPPGGLHRYIRRVEFPEPGFVLVPQVHRHEEIVRSDRRTTWTRSVLPHLPTHGGYVLAFSAIYGLLLSVSFATEIAYSFDRFASHAWTMMLATFFWAFTTTLLAFWVRSGRAIAGSEFISFVAMTTVLFIALLSWFAMFRVYLPSESLVQFTEFRAHPAQAGLLKSTVWYLSPLLLLSSSLYHAGLGLQSFADLRAETAAWRIRWWSIIAAAIAIIIVLIGFIAIPSTNRMIDAVAPGPYRNLFALAVQTRVGLWFSLPILSLAWFASILSNIRVELSHGSL